MTSLTEALYTQPTERLREMVQARGVDTKKLALTPNKRHLAQALANELSRPPSVALGIAQCNVRELRLLQLLAACVNNGILSWAKLLEAVGGGPALSEALGNVMTRLEALGLAFRTPEGVLLPPSVQQYVPISLSDRHTLARCLNLYDAPSLRRICDKLGLRPERDTKAILIEAICTHLLHSAPGLKLKTPLDDEEMAVLDYLVQAGGASTAMEVASTALEGRTDEFFRYDWQNRWKQGRERNAVDRLLVRGLVHVVSYGYGFNLFLVLPGDLLRALTGNAEADFWTAPPAAPTALPEPPPCVTRHNTLIRDVVGLLGFLASQEATRTNTGHIHKTSLKNLARTLTLPDERYATFLYAVCREAGLIATHGEKMVYALTGKGASWLHWDAQAQAQTLFEAWRDGATWAEMYNEPLKKGNDYRPTESVVGMRRAALNLLTENPTDAFYATESLTETLTFRYPLLLAQSTLMGPDLVPSPANFIRQLVGECLYWLGLVELGWKEPPVPVGEIVMPGRASKAAGKTARAETTLKPPAPDPLACHLTPLGAYLLGVEGAEAPPEEPREDRFIVQANAEIFVPPYLEPAALYHLLALTEIPAKGATGNTVYLTRESIRRALDQGETIREILAFLQGHARTGIPQNVEYLINEVGGKHGHIHIGQAQMYLQVDSPLLMKELQAHRELKPYFVRSLSETVALLRGDDPDKLLRELRKAGYLPVSDDATSPNAFRPGGGGHPTPPNAKPALPAPEKPARRAAKANSEVDWDRIALEDGKSYKPALTTSVSSTYSRAKTTEAPDGAARNPELIKFLLAQAAGKRRCIEVAYQSQGEPESSVYVLEPQRIMGGFVNAYNRETKRHDSFNINRILWARLTPEVFEA